MTQATQPPSGGATAAHPFALGPLAFGRIDLAANRIDAALAATGNTRTEREIVDAVSAALVPLETLYDAVGGQPEPGFVVGSEARNRLGGALDLFNDLVDLFDEGRIATSAIAGDLDDALGELFELIRRARRVRAAAARGA